MGERKKIKLDGLGAIIHVVSVEQTSLGGPTIFEFADHKRTTYRFCLRHGMAKIHRQSDDAVVIQEDMANHKELCTWNDVVAWAAKQGIYIRTCV